MGYRQTGTGKTAGFTLPILHRLTTTRRTGPRRIRALILTLTRELAAQVEESVRGFLGGAHLPFKSLVMFGGVGMNPQISACAKVSTSSWQHRADCSTAQRKEPRFLRHRSAGADEADRMLDMGFINDIRKVLALLRRNART